MLTPLHGANRDLATSTSILTYPHIFVSIPLVIFIAIQEGTLTDAHALVPTTPVTDEGTQDWTLISSEIGNGSLVFEAERALDTGDTQDRVLVDDTEDGERKLFAGAKIEGGSGYKEL